VVGGSRPVIHSENNVIFSHVGFARMTNGATVGCPVVADPPRLSAGRAYTVSLRVLTLTCRAKLPGSSFLLIPSTPRAAEAVLGSLCTRRLRTTHGLGVCLVDARAPSIGLIPALRRGGRNAERIVRAFTTVRPLRTAPPSPPG